MPKARGNEMTETIEKKSKRGPKPISQEAKRGHCVSARMNSAELKWLDEHRGHFQRGEYIRMAAMGKLPRAAPPAINQQSYNELARAAANLNQLSKRANAGHVVEINELTEALSEFRISLLGAKI